MMFKIADESRILRKELAVNTNIICTITLTIIVILIGVFTPILAYFDFEITHIKTDFWTLRYFAMFFYILFNVLINIFPLVNNFLFFISDGFILSQITCLYLANEFSITCFLSIAPVLFVI